MIETVQRHTRSLFPPIGLMCLTCAFSAIALEYLPMPYVFVAGLCALVASIAAIYSVRPWAKAFYFNAAIVMIGLAGAEVYFYEMYFADEPPREVEYRLMGESASPNSIIESFDYHEKLGYAYRKQPGFTQTTRFKGQLLYEVSYTLDEHGLRISPPFNRVSTTKPSCVVFFGDSFTFGEGVKDDETLPYRTGLKTQNRYQVYNFGFLGYGPHQMLAQLQHELVHQAIRCSPRYAIYQALPSHVSRAAGLELWDQAGPQYILNKEGKIEAQAHFNDHPKPGAHAALRRLHQTLPYHVRRCFEKSAVYRGILYMRRTIETRDIALFAGLVDETHRFLVERYPGIEFHILFWDFSHQTDATEIETIEALKKTKIPLHLISSVVPDYAQQRDRYILHPADGHPNKVTYDLIADYLIGKIIKPTTALMPLEVVQDNRRGFP